MYFPLFILVTKLLLVIFFLTIKLTYNELPKVFVEQTAVFCNYIMHKIKYIVRETTFGSVN